MNRREKVVFTLVSAHTGASYPVIFWSGYGIVAPTLWTTNGNIGYVARLCSDHVRHGSYIVGPSTLDPQLDFTARPALFEALRSAFCEWDSLPKTGPR